MHVCMDKWVWVCMCVCVCVCVCVPHVGMYVYVYSYFRKSNQWANIGGQSLSTLSQTRSAIVINACIVPVGTCWGCRAFQGKVYWNCELSRRPSTIIIVMKLENNVLTTSREAQAKAYKNLKTESLLVALLYSPLYFIYKHNNPHCFKNINKEKLPVVYYHQRNLWMNGVIFNSLFANKFVPHCRKALQDFLQKHFLCWIMHHLTQILRSLLLMMMIKFLAFFCHRILLL